MNCLNEEKIGLSMKSQDRVRALILLQLGSNVQKLGESSQG